MNTDPVHSPGSRARRCGGSAAVPPGPARRRDRVRRPRPDARPGARLRPHRLLLPPVVGLPARRRDRARRGLRRPARLGAERFESGPLGSAVAGAGIGLGASAVRGRARRARRQPVDRAGRRPAAAPASPRLASRGLLARTRGRLAEGAARDALTVYVDARRARARRRSRSSPRRSPSSRSLFFARLLYGARRRDGEKYAGPAHPPVSKKLILAVIDGAKPAMLERARRRGPRPDPRAADRAGHLRPRRRRRRSRRSRPSAPRRSSPASARTAT